MNRRVIRLPLEVLIVAVLLLGYLWLYGQINAKLDEQIFHQPRGEILGTPADRGLPYEDVSFPTAEGLTLRGWLVPGSPDKAIILASGYTETRWNVLKYTPFLHQAGYTLLLFDPRGTGESDGKLYAFGHTSPRTSAPPSNILRAGVLKRSGSSAIPTGRPRRLSPPPRMKIF